MLSYGCAVMTRRFFITNANGFFSDSHSPRARSLRPLSPLFSAEPHASGLVVWGLMSSFGCGAGRRRRSSTASMRAQAPRQRPSVLSADGSISSARAPDLPALQEAHQARRDAGQRRLRLATRAREMSSSATAWLICVRRSNNRSGISPSLTALPMAGRTRTRSLSCVLRCVARVSRRRELDEGRAVCHPRDVLRYLATRVALWPIAPRGARGITRTAPLDTDACVNMNLGGDAPC